MRGKRIILLAGLAVLSGLLWGEEVASRQAERSRSRRAQTVVQGVLPERVSAHSALLVDGKTGEILFEREAHERRAPASITKIMTAVLLLEKGRLKDTVVVSRPVTVGGYTLGLKVGQRISLEDLLKAILVGSANDAAVVAARHVAGSEERFVAMMNAKAAALGMRDTLFQNPHGLDAFGHYSTAYDLAILTRYALAHPLFAQVVRSQKVWVTIQDGRGRARRVLLRTHNRLLGWYEGADGVKTGYTSEAGPSLIASATRGDRRLIAILLNDHRRWLDAASLFEYGFGTSAALKRGKVVSMPRPGRWESDEGG